MLAIAIATACLNVTADVRDVFEDPEIQAVVIATPVKSHFDLAMRALGAGKHIMVEKPIATTVAEVDEIGDLAAESVPPEFLQQDVFRRMYVKHLAGANFDRTTPRQLLTVERRAAGDEDIDLQHRRLMNQIDAPLGTHGAVQRTGVHVEIR